MSVTIALPRVGVVGMAYGGYNLGEELGPAKLDEMLRLLAARSIEAVPAESFVLTSGQAAAAGRYLADRRVDCLLVLATTFVPDYFLLDLVRECDVPVFVWAVERELQCIFSVGALLNTGTLFNLGKHYRLCAADTGDPAALGELAVFARAALFRRILATSRIGFSGESCPIMFNLAPDQDALARTLGVRIVTIPVEEFYRRAETISPGQVQACWTRIKQSVGSVTAAEPDGLVSVRHYLAARALAEEHRLDALSLNCFPDLKSRLCLALALLNDDGIAAACEGDLHSTILMRLLSAATGRAAFNGDFLRLCPEHNDILFSHCGAGAFSLAGDPSGICLRCSIETKDGLAVSYATRLAGPVTLLNLMASGGRLRLTALRGEASPTDLTYEGTPLRVRFAEPVAEVLRRTARCGAGHHWNGAPGDLTGELELLGEFLGVSFTRAAG